MQMLLKLDLQLIKRLFTFKKTGKDMPACLYLNSAFANTTSSIKCLCECTTFHLSSTTFGTICLPFRGEVLLEDFSLFSLHFSTVIS